MPRRDSPYSGPEWKAVRLQVLARDGYRCMIRLPGCTGRATQVDHIVSMSNGGSRLDPANLRAACRSCNIAQRNIDVAARARGEPAGAVGFGWCRAHEGPAELCGGPHSERWF